MPSSTPEVSLQTDKSNWREVILGPANPSVSLEISIDPSVYSVRSPDLPLLSLRITSHASRPVTICTINTVLSKDRLFMKGHKYSALDVTCNQRVWFGTEHVNQRGTYQQQLGHPDERHFLTLLPGVPVTITYPFLPVDRWRQRDPSKGLTFRPKAANFKGEEFRRYFEPGHKYRVGITNEQNKIGAFGLGSLWWQYGTKEEVLAPRDAPPSEARLGRSERPIKFQDVQDVDLAIEE